MKNRGPALVGQFLRKMSIIPEGFLSSVRLKKTIQKIDKNEPSPPPVETGEPGGVLESNVDTSTTDENVWQQVELVPGESFPVLHDRVVDDAYGIPIQINKSIVAPNDAIPSIPSGYVGEVERQGLDKWASIQMQSLVDLEDLPSDFTFYTSAKYAFPNILTGVGVTYDSQTSEHGTANGVVYLSDWTAGNVGEKESWDISARASSSAILSAQPWVSVVKGKAGVFTAKVVRKFRTLAQLSVDTEAQNWKRSWDEVYGSVLVTLKSGSAEQSSGKSGRGTWSAQTSGGHTTSLKNDVIRYEFGPVIHSGGFSVSNPSSVSASGSASGGSVPGGGVYPAAGTLVIASGTAELKLPACLTPPPSEGSWVLISVDVEPWRWGVLVVEELYIKYL